MAAEPNTETAEVVVGPENEPSEKPGLFEPFALPDGRSAVLFPSAFSTERGNHLMGVLVQEFDTPEEAVAAAGDVRASIEERFDMADFERAYGDTGVIPADTGGFIVLEEGENGRTAKSFEDWHDAADFYAETQPDQSSESPITSLELSGGVVSFADFNNFNPDAPARREALPVPSEIGEYLEERERQAQNGKDWATYRHTVERPHWQRELFTHVSEQLEGQMAHLKEELSIENARLLTPRQAAELSTRLVMELHKYSEDAGEGGAAADAKDVLSILREGNENRGNPDWEGNGVCRNVAASVKAVFESLKANQNRYSRLQDTYCTVESGMDSAYKPGSADHVSRDGHAWNSFVTVHRDGESDVTMADVTWAKQELDMGRELKLDYTAERMEPFVYDQAMNHLRSKDKEAALKVAGAAVDYYAGLMSGLHGKPGSEDPIRHYSTRALSLIDGYHMADVPPEMVRPLLHGFIERVENDATGRGDLHRNLETLWNLKSQVNGAETVEFYVQARLKKEGLSRGQSSRGYEVTDPELQSAIFRALEKSFGKEELQKKLQDIPTLRSRYEAA